MSHRIIDRRAGSADRIEPLNPVAISPGLFNTPRNTGELDYYRPRPYRFADISVTLNDYDWYDMLALSRQLFAQVGNLAAAILQKNMYAVGEAFQPLYAGRNKAWGDEATEWLLHQWYPTCDIRGGVFDFQTNLFLSGLSWDVDGDDAVIFIKDAETGYPLLKHVAAYSIGSRGYVDRVKGGPFDGARIHNGIICDDQDRFLGIQVLGKDTGGKEDLQVPAASCQLSFEPEWRGQYRGIPRVGRVLMDWLDVSDIDTFLKRIIKREASVGLLHSTESGEPGPNSDLIVERTAADPGSSSEVPLDIKIERRMGGEDYYLHAGVGEKVETLDSNRPSQNSEGFVARIERRGLAALGWAYELIDSSKIGGANVRLVQDIARHVIRARQRNLKKRAKRCVQSAVATAMETGRISRNSDGDDWMRWHFNLPAQLTVDQGYDEKADQDNLRNGSTTMAAVCQKKGESWQNVRQQREVENQNLIDAATRLVEYSGGKLSFREALDLMAQNNPNQRAEKTGEQPE